MYNKSDINQLSDRYNYVRSNMEKVVRLVSVLEELNRQPIFAEYLALKGGTAINLLVTPLPRLSVDIDLDFTYNCEKTEMMRHRREITQRLQAYMFSQGYRLSPQSKNPTAIDSWVFQYTDTSGNNDNIKVEINYVMRSHILPIITMPLHFPEVSTASVRTLSTTELYSTKLKALLERGAARDLFDVDNMLQMGIIPDSEYPILRKAAIFYSVVGGKGVPISGFSTEAIDRIKFPIIRSDLLPMLKKGTFYDLEAVKNRVVSFIKETLQPEEKERQFIQSFARGAYIPSLLFDDDEIIERISSHPMAIWKAEAIKRNL